MVKTSVIVPVYNDPGGIRTTLESLVAQTAEDYEVVVVDNGSTDETTAVVAEYTDERVVCHVTERAIQNSYAARNTGIEASRGEYLCFLDADTWVRPTYVSQVTQVMRHGDYDYAGCRVEVVDDHGAVGRFVAATAFPVERFLETDQFAPTCCLVVHRRVVDAVGRFDGHLVSGGDVEFGRRVAAADFDQVYLSDLTVFHPTRSSLVSLWSKYVRVGRGRAQLARRHGNRFDAHPLWDPRNYLPTTPRTPASRGTKPESFTGLGTWAALTWVTKLAIARGRLLERAGR